MLSEADVRQYHHDGLLIPRYRLSEDRLGEIREAYAKFVADNPQVHRDQVVNPHLRYSAAQGTHGDSRWLEVANHPPILDMVEQLIGPDFLLWGMTFFGKPAGTGKTIPWHQDGDYWPIRPLANISVWIALDECTAENGCLRYIPGSHKMNRVGRHIDTNHNEMLLEKALHPSEFEESRARDLLLQAGQMAMFDVFLVHGSNANRSPQRRAALVLRIMPTTSHFDRELGIEIGKTVRPPDMGTRPLFLLRGIDRCGLNDLRVGHEVAG